jgi:hypothetical protein
MTKAATTTAYGSRTRPATGMSLSDLKLRSYVVGEVVHLPTDTVAWTSRMYGDARAAMLQANRMKPRYEAHLRRTGERWEVQEQQRKEAERAEKKAKADKARALRDAAPELRDALAKLEAATIAAVGTTGLNVQLRTSLADAKALLERLA